MDKFGRVVYKHPGPGRCNVEEFQDLVDSGEAVPIIRNTKARNTRGKPQTADMMPQCVVTVHKVNC